MKLSKNDVVLFSGDSITDGNRGKCMDCNHIMGHGYQYIVASQLALENAENMPKFINKGYTGERSEELLKKWQEDVIDNKPPQLPQTDNNGKPITYQEFDVNNKLPGSLRDAERFVRGSDGRTYYTPDHYNTFQEIID